MDKPNVNPGFSIEHYDDWKIRMMSYLSAIHDAMTSVVESGPYIPMKVNTTVAGDPDAPQMLEKPKMEWTPEDYKRANLDRVAKNIRFKSLDTVTFSKVKMLKSSKEIWERITMLCEGNDQIKTNRLQLAMEKFDNFKMKPGEKLEDMEGRMISLLYHLSQFGKVYENREINYKILKSLPKEWSIKIMMLKGSKDLNKMSTMELSSDLKAHEYDLEQDNNKPDSSAVPMNSALIVEGETPSISLPGQSQEELSLLANKINKFYIRRNQKPGRSSGYKKTNQYQDKASKSKVESTDENLCYHCKSLVIT